MIVVACCRTGMAGVPGTASDIFDTVKSVGANVIMISQVRNMWKFMHVCYSALETFLYFLNTDDAG